jgi:hypothetical protein
MIRYRMVILGLAPVVGTLSFSALAHDAKGGYFGRPDEPAFNQRYADAPALPSPKEAIEAFAKSVGLIVDQSRFVTADCLGSSKMRLEGPPPASCANLIRLKGQGNSQEMYLVLYDTNGLAYAVESTYQYTGL